MSFLQQRCLKSPLRALQGRLPVTLLCKQSRFYYMEPRPTPLRLPITQPSLLPLIHTSSNLYIENIGSGPMARYIVSNRTEKSHVNKENVVPFYMSAPSLGYRPPLGFLRPLVADALMSDHAIQVGQSRISPWDIHYSQESDHDIISVSFAQWVNESGNTQRTHVMERLLAGWRNNGIFPDILRGSFIFHPTRLIRD